MGDGLKYIFWRVIRDIGISLFASGIVGIFTDYTLITTLGLIFLGFLGIILGEGLTYRR